MHLKSYEVPRDTLVAKLVQVHPLVALSCVGRMCAQMEGVRVVYSCAHNKQRVEKKNGSKSGPSAPARECKMEHDEGMMNVRIRQTKRRVSGAFLPAPLT